MNLFALNGELIDIWLWFFFFSHWHLNVADAAVLRSVLIEALEKSLLLAMHHHNHFQFPMDPLWLAVEKDNAYDFPLCPFYLYKRAKNTHKF